jgi:hypothetical protein
MTTDEIAQDAVCDLLFSSVYIFIYTPRAAAINKITQNVAGVCVMGASDLFPTAHGDLQFACVGEN